MLQLLQSCINPMVHPWMIQRAVADAGDTSVANLSLGSNTKLVDWAPQNDVLGHPAVKAFVTHAGINSVYEAAYHAKPVVAVPLIADQPENAVKVNQTNLLIAGRCVIASACC